MADRQGGTATWTARAHALATAPEARELYDAWAPTYDDDVTGPHGDDYPLPTTVAEVVARLGGPGTDVLDAACGTGLVGEALARLGFRSIDGLDLSPKMLARARTRGVYHDLGPADLSQRLPGAGDKFGVVTCVNAFEPGHLPRSALVEFARVVHRGGHLVLTVGAQRRAEIERYLEQLARRQIVRVAETFEALLHPSTGECHLVAVLEVAATTSPRGPRQ
ncbi:class I SAM-dependent methyltransferase [Actinomycetospora sp. TBRC 11914]|uniref:class I SAM-dependent DNA methyltransferase n=1 Tax=Actinomycetospora sp. TBRC 11914 TaxID=2729387 RepID=UPI00145DDE6C|nr:class I SAM-dependent methyltransferase [Actinomycetospora sp. TBRC 11914]NMO89589.1 class I SAM-dependent methyltransferase [Actinomycetospora sp. TBRC 11914]